MKEKNKEKENDLRTIPVEDAVGTVLMHDITRIIPGREKGPAFKRGYIIKKEDIEILKDLGKENIYAFDIPEDRYHENKAAEKFRSFAGENVFAGEPSESKVTFKAQKDGLVIINKSAVNSINRIGDIALTTIHTDIPVREGDLIGGIRTISLIIKKDKVLKALKIAGDAKLIEVRPFEVKRVALIVTGREVASGRIKDKFRPVIEKKVKEYNSSIVHYVLAGDDREKITEEIQKAVNKGCNFIILTGGMSVDPDDKTQKAIKDAGVETVRYGVPILPGNMFMSGYIKDIPVFGVPACALFYDTTVLDIFIPYVFSNTRIKRDMITSRGYGGFCRHCKVCVYPRCALGKF